MDGDSWIPFSARVFVSTQSKPAPADAYILHDSGRSDLVVSSR